MFSPVFVAFIASRGHGFEVNCFPPGESCSILQRGWPPRRRKAERDRNRDGAAVANFTAPLSFFFSHFERAKKSLDVPHIIIGHVRDAAAEGRVKGY